MQRELLRDSVRVLCDTHDLVLSVKDRRLRGPSFPLNEPAGTLGIKGVADSKETEWFTLLDLDMSACKGTEEKGTEDGVILLRARTTGDIILAFAITSFYFTSGGKG